MELPLRLPRQNHIHAKDVRLKKDETKKITCLPRPTVDQEYQEYILAPAVLLPCTTRTAKRTQTAAGRREDPGEERGTRGTGGIFRFHERSCFYGLLMLTSSSLVLFSRRKRVRPYNRSNQPSNHTKWTAVRRHYGNISDYEYFSDDSASKLEKDAPTTAGSDQAPKGGRGARVARHRRPKTVRKRARGFALRHGGVKYIGCRFLTYDIKHTRNTKRKIDLTGEGSQVRICIPSSSGEMFHFFFAPPLHLFLNFSFFRPAFPSPHKRFNFLGAVSI